MVDRERSDDILNLVLGNITLPIFDITEKKMLENVTAWGYMGVMQHILFCHRPIDGKPCGLCSPCHTKVDNGMGFLLPEAAKRRYRHIETAKKLFGKYGERSCVRAVRAVRRA